MESNILTIMADEVGRVFAEAEALQAQSAEKALEAGTLLNEAKAECRHGEWLPFLARAGIPERKAQRLMKLAASGLTSDTVSDLGGITGALTFLHQRRLPGPGMGLCILPHREESDAGMDADCALIWESATSPGFFYVTVARWPEAGDGEVAYVGRPMSGTPIALKGAAPFHPVWAFVEQHLGRPQTEWHFHHASEEGLRSVADALRITDFPHHAASGQSDALRTAWADRLDAAQVKLMDVQGKLGTRVTRDSQESWQAVKAQRDIERILAGLEPELAAIVRNQVRQPTLISAA